MKNNENFVLSTFDHHLDLFRPRKGIRQLAEIVYYLNKRSPHGITNFEESLASYKKLINSKALIIIISDFLYDPQEIKAVLHRMKRNKIKLIQVQFDPGFARKGGLEKICESQCSVFLNIPVFEISLDVDRTETIIRKVNCFLFAFTGRNSKIKL